MPPTDGGDLRPAWMPAPARIVSEQALRPGRPAVAPAAVPASRTYRILRTDEVDPYDTPLQPAETSTLGIERFAGLGDDFAGTARKAAKLSIAAAPPETFADLPDLINTLPADNAMVNHVPQITTAATSNRVDEEQRNVRVRAFLYAASRENDNDYHLIVGRDPNLAPSLYMTAEVSGLPPASSASFAPLKGARDAYQGFFADNLPGASYDFYDPPIPVEVEGSLFFDMTHATGSHPGPSTLRPHIPTIWEIHPVSAIVFEP